MVLRSPCSSLAGHPCVVDLQEPLREIPPRTRLEVNWRRLDALIDWLAASGKPWSLRMEGLVPGEEDELQVLQELLRRAREAGCERVLVSLRDPEGAPLEMRELLMGDRAYRYRLFGLLRGLCDEQGLKFAALELGEVPAQLRFNRFFGTAKPCCRAFPEYPESPPSRGRSSRNQERRS